jgi:hypothetical protein
MSGFEIKSSVFFANYNPIGLSISNKIVSIFLARGWDAGELWRARLPMDGDNAKNFKRREGVYYLNHIINITQLTAKVKGFLQKRIGMGIAGRFGLEPA